MVVCRSLTGGLAVVVSAGVLLIAACSPAASRAAPYLGAGEAAEAPKPAEAAKPAASPAAAASPVAAASSRSSCESRGSGQSGGESGRVGWIAQAGERFGVPPDPTAHYFYYAQENGFYRQRGLNLDIQLLPDDQTSLRALASASPTALPATPTQMPMPSR